METIHILHTNDIHSHFEYWPQIHRFLKEQRQTFEEKGDSVFVFDVGDHVDRSHSFTEGTNGKGNIQLLNAAKYDAVTIGNNEGITMSKESLSSLYDEATFDVIVGNLRHQNGARPRWAIPSNVYETRQHTKIGVVGATAYYKDFYGALGWEVLDAQTTLLQEVEKIKDQVDIIICLSHLGLTSDRNLAEACPEIDLILGAHTHHVLLEGEEVNNSLLGAAGKFGDYVGHATLQFDKKKIIHKEAILYRSASLKATKEDYDETEKIIANGREALKEKVFYNPTNLRQNLFGMSELASFFGRALIDYTNADCALFNAGIFLGSLSKGWVTKGDVHQLLPHPINVCTVELTGEQLTSIYYDSMHKELAHIEVKGLGFRGTLMGKILHERLYENHKGELFAGNRPVVAGESYTLATLDMFTFGFFFPLLKEVRKEYLMPDLIRDIFMAYGKRTMMN